MLKHHARLLCTTITTRQLMSKHTTITTLLRTHPAHLPSHLPTRRRWLLPTICLPRHHTSLLETTIIPIMCDTDLIHQIHLLMRIRRKSLRQGRNKRNQLRSLIVPAVAPSKAPLPYLLSSSSCQPRRPLLNLPACPAPACQNNLAVPSDQLSPTPTQLRLQSTINSQLFRPNAMCFSMAAAAIA